MCQLTFDDVLCALTDRVVLALCVEGVEDSGELDNRCSN